MMKTALLICTFLVSSLPMQAVELPKLIAETQRLAQEPQRWTMVWWIPTEFWQATLEKNPNLTEVQRTGFLKVLDEYSIFAVAVLDVGPFGGLTARSRETIVENVTFTIDGAKQAILGPTEVSSDAGNFVRLMKPMMAQMLGQVGQGMEFLLYANPPPKGKKLHAAKEGAFRFQAFDKSYDWKLPLQSLLPPKVDSKTKQEFPGDYRFNPYTGDALSVK